MEGLCLALEIAALETEDTIGECILLRLGNILADNLNEVGEGHDGSAHDEVELILFVLATQVFGMTVGKTDGAAHLLSDTYFLACAVDEFEFYLRKEDGEGDARKTTTRAEIEYTGARTEVDDLSDGEGVEHVVLIEVVDILA